MLYIDDIFNFLTDRFLDIIRFVFNLEINLTPELKINFGIFLISCFVIGLCIRFIFNAFGFDNIFTFDAFREQKIENAYIRNKRIRQRVNGSKEGGN